MGQIPGRFILTAAVLAAALMPPDSNRFWGLGAMADWPPAVRLSILIAGLLLIWAPTRDPRVAHDSDIGHRASSRFEASIAALLALGIVAVWIFLPCRTLLFGDSADIVLRTSLGDVTTPRSPLYNMLALGLTRTHLVQGFGESERALRFVSMVCGLLYLAGLFLFRRRRRGRIHWVTWALLAGGYLALFQNYIEAYAAFLVVLAAFMATLTEPPTGRRDAILAILSILAIGFHSLGLLLVPFVLFFIWRRNRTSILLWSGATALTLVVLLLTLRGKFPSALRYMDPSQVLSHFVSEWGLFAPRPWSARLISLDHLSEVLNTALLSSGITLFAGLLLLTFPGGRTSLVRIFRSPAGALALLFLGARFLIATPLGPLLDWDLMALFFWPLAFCVALAWSEPEAAAARTLSPAVLAVALVLAGPWWWTLSSGEASTRFLMRYRDASPAIRPYVAARVEHCLGEEHVRAGRQREGAEAFSRACDFYPRDTYARRAGVAWQNSGNEDRARAEFERAVHLNPGDVDSRRLLGMSLFEAGEEEAAGREFRAVVAAIPDDGRAHFGLGLLAARSRDDEQKKEHMEIAAASLRRRPDSMTSRNFSDRVMLARALMELEHFEAALSELNALVQEAPDDPRVLYSRGTCLLHLGRLAEARDVFEHGAQVRPGDIEFLSQLADLSLRLKDWTRAADAYTRALEIENQSIFRFRRAHVYLEMDEVARAGADVDSLLAADPENPALRDLKAKVSAAARH